ncbi:MAG: CheR family methyltransferase [Verrucomicrobiota bacterium]
MSTTRLEAFLEERLGLLCVDWQRTRLAELVAQHRLGELSSADAGGRQPTREELQALIEQLLIGETYFFREPAHLAVLADVAVPERLQRREPGRAVRILSIGCSSGEEAYSCAITLSDHRSDITAGRITIEGIDVSAAAIHKARRARYSAWALRATPAAVRERCFFPEGEDYQLRPELRALVQFEERNLLDPEASSWTPGGFDILFCRNVLIYFSERSIRLAVSRLAQALAPGGFLFLGHSETLRGISDEFELCHTRESFFYRKKPLPRAAAPRSAAETKLPSDTDGAALGVPSSWFTNIARSAERIARLTSALTPPPATEARRPDSADVWTPLLPVAQRISSEQFDQALDLMRQLPAEVAPSGPALLTKATLLCGQGRYSEARKLCGRLLDDNQQVAEAHYLLGLGQEHVDEKESAQKSHEESIRADPRFAMAHLRLGIVLRRGGQRDAARAALRQALELLPHERRERILLFGGGFAREALLSLCRAELRALGGEE